MYSLTKATQELLTHYEIGSKDGSKEVLTYNAHKVRHTLWVLETWRNLIIKINENQFISKDTIKRAEIVFIHHDLWRFYQNDKIKVLSNKEFEHGDFSSEIAKKLWYDEKICLAIKYHNKYDLSGLFENDIYINMSLEDKDETLFLSKVIRDVDKLQNMIYTIFDVDGLTRLDPKFINWDISDKIINEIKELKPSNRDNMVSKADDVVWVLWRIFDINFKESLEMLKYYWYTNKIITALSKMPFVSKNKIDELKNIFKNY